MRRALQLAAAVLRDDEAQDVVEYALLACLIGLASVASINALAVKIATNFNAVGSVLTSAT